MAQDERLKKALEIGLEIGMGALNDAVPGIPAGAAVNVLMMGFMALLKELGIDTASIEVKTKEIEIHISD